MELFSYTIFKVLPFLLNINPSTGDRNFELMGIIIPAMIISALLILVYVIVYMTKKKKGQGGTKRKK